MQEKSSGFSSSKTRISFLYATRFNAPVRESVVAASSVLLRCFLLYMAIEKQTTTSPTSFLMEELFFGLIVPKILTWLSLSAIIAKETSLIP